MIAPEGATTPEADRCTLARRARILSAMQRGRSAAAQAALAGSARPIVPLCAINAAPAWMLLPADRFSVLTRTLAAALAALAMKHSLDGRALQDLADWAGSQTADWALNLPTHPAMASAASGPAAAAAGRVDDRLQQGRALLARLLASGDCTAPLAPLLGAPASISPDTARWLLGEALAFIGSAEGGGT